MKKAAYGAGRIALTVLSSTFTHSIGFASIVNLATEFPLATGFITKCSNVKITSLDESCEHLSCNGVSVAIESAVEIE